MLRAGVKWFISGRFGSPCIESKMKVARQSNVSQIWIFSNGRERHLIS